jgi:hypothetical protein
VDGVETFYGLSDMKAKPESQVLQRGPSRLKNNAISPALPRRIAGGEKAGGRKIN